ncbi:putative ribonuclease H-like domain-containing protein [Tanacetum coccineum]|uniref:Ribonuclease H-like domain-containing protein n=1 Tax=Tanacetum coccineum TaxID=301880 RepID=A0ABQ5BJF2_9ASTR
MTAPSTSSTNNVNTAKPAYEVSTASPNVNTASPQVSTTNFSDNVVYAFMIENPNGSNILQQDLEKIHEDDLEVMDLKWQLSLLSMRAKRECRASRNKEGQFRNQDNTRKHGNNEDTSSKAMLAIDGVVATYKRGLATIEEQLITYRKNEVLFSEEVAVLKREVACKYYEINVLKSEFEKVKQEKEGIEFKIEKFDKASKDLDKLLGSQITDKSKKGLGYNVVPPPHHLIYNQLKNLDLSYSDLDEFKEPEFKSYGSQESKQESNIVCDKKSDASKENSNESLIVKPKNHEKPVKKSVRYAEMYSSQSPRGNQRNWNGQKSNQLGSDFVMYNKACFIYGSFDHVQAHCKYHQRERMVYGNNYNKVNYNYTTNKTYPNAQRNMVPRAVLIETGPQPFNTARTVNTAHPKSTVFSATSMSRFSKLAQSIAKVVNTARPKVVTTARPHSTVVNAVRFNQANAVRFNQANAVKTLACWVWRPTKLDSASITLKKHNYINARGRSKKGNMYSFDMKNIVPKESLTCLVKATSDESMLWHKRLGHINFKNINKLVKDNLILKNFIKEIENLVDKKVKIIRSDNGTEFKNKVMDGFCREKGIKREYIIARTLQQNGLAKRRNRTLIEAARTMLADSKLPTTFWAEAFSTTCYVQDRVLVVKPHNKTPYELFRGFKPALSFIRLFGCHVTILNTLDNLVAAGTITNESTSKQGELNAGTSTQKEEINQDCIVMPIWKDVSYFDSPFKDVGNGEPKSATDDQKQVEDGLDNENDEKDKYEEDSSPKEVNTARQHVNTASPEVNTGCFKLNTVDPSVNTASSSDPDSPKYMFTVGASHTLKATHVEFFSNEDEPEVDLGNILNSYTVSTSPNTRIHKDHPIKNVIGDVKSFVQTRRMTKPTSEQGFLSVEELLQFKLQQVWKLVDLPNGKRAIGTKWVFRNKKDEKGIVIRNKARLVAHGHRQEDGIDYEEVFATVARIEAIRLFLAYASFIVFGDIKMDDEVVKVLYGLHQAPGAWYETLANYLLGNGFKRGKIYQTLFIKKQKGDSLLVHVYVDDIIFSSTNKELCTAFEKLIKDKFQMSSMGELTFFLGLQDKYVAEILKKFNYTDVKSASTLVDLEKPLVKDGDADDVDVILYRSNDRVLDVFLQQSRPDIQFACKKQTVVATSTTEDEYVAATSCYGQDKHIEYLMLKASPLKSCLRGGYLCQYAVKQGNGYPRKGQKRSQNDKAEHRMEEREKDKVKSKPKELVLVVAHVPRYHIGGVDAQTRFDTTSKQSNDPPLSRVNILGSGKDNMKLMELMAHCITLSELQTAGLSTNVDGVRGITATTDRKVKVFVSEASIRRHLKLEDFDGISSLPTAEIFKQLALIKYAITSNSLTFPKGHFFPQWKFFIHIILHCLSPKKTAWEQFSSNIATAIIFLATNRTFNFSNFIFEAMVKNLDSKSKFLMYPRFIQIFLNKHKRMVFPHKRTFPTPTLTQKLFSNMKRASKGYSGVDISLFPTMLTTPESSPSKITSSPSLLPQTHPSTSQPLSIPQSNQTIPITEEAAPIPHKLPLQSKVESLESRLKQTKQTYHAALTKLIKQVKKLEQTIKISQARRRATVFISDAEEDEEDPSKQGRCLIEELDLDAGISLVPPQAAD